MRIWQTKTRRQRDLWEDIACDLYNAAQEQDYKIMVHAMKRYEQAAGHNEQDKKCRFFLLRTD
jgi:hypothetical protein